MQGGLCRTPWKRNPVEQRGGFIVGRIGGSVGRLRETFGLSRGLFPRCIARQRLPHIRVRNSELSSDLRWLEPRFEGCTNCIQLARCQSNGNLFDPSFL